MHAHAPSGTAALRPQNAPPAYASSGSTGHVGTAAAGSGRAGGLFWSSGPSGGTSSSTTAAPTGPYGGIAAHNRNPAGPHGGSTSSTGNMMSPILSSQGANRYPPILPSSTSSTAHGLPDQSNTQAQQRYQYPYHPYLSSPTSAVRPSQGTTDANGPYAGSAGRAAVPNVGMFPAGRTAVQGAASSVPASSSSSLGHAAARPGGCMHAHSLLTPCIPYHVRMHISCSFEGRED